MLIHSLVDRIMEVMGTSFVEVGKTDGFQVPEFLKGRQPNIIYKGKHIGEFGIVHPQVLNNFGIPDLVSRSMHLHGN